MMFKTVLASLLIAFSFYHTLSVRLWFWIMCCNEMDSFSCVIELVRNLILPVKMCCSCFQGESNFYLQLSFFSLLGGIRLWNPKTLCLWLRSMQARKLFLFRKTCCFQNNLQGVWKSGSIHIHTGSISLNTDITSNAQIDGLELLLETCVYVVVWWCHMQRWFPPLVQCLLKQIQTFETSCVVENVQKCPNCLCEEISQARAFPLSNNRNSLEPRKAWGLCLDLYVL